MSKHPIEKFKAPMAIMAGQPLKDLFDSKLIALIGQSFGEVAGDFDLKVFKKQAIKGLADRTLFQRSIHIAEALAAQLPADFKVASKILIAALGPKQANTEGNGLRPFFYLPHSAYVAKYGVGNFKEGMQVCYELTQRFSAEFCVRPFVERHQKKCLTLLKKWTRDKDVHVRRLCSEGTRPRLPWASRLVAMSEDPELALPLLEALKDDVDLYVRRSVANHIGDLCKDHPEWAFELCSRWIDEVEGASEERSSERHWLVRHAVRLPAKKKVKAALELRERARIKRLA